MASIEAPRGAPVHRIVVLALLLGVLTLPWIGRFPFSTRGEPREALVAQAMIETGEWILPRGYSDDVPSKPPFMHWIIGGLSAVAGDVSEFNSRFPSAFGALLFTLAFYVFLARRTGESTAWLTAIVLSLSVEWFRAATACRVDMTLSALLAGALLGLFGWAERGLRGFPWVAAALLVAATWTKGPVSVVLPGAILGLFLLTEGVALRRVVGRALLLGIPVLGCAAVWYALAWRQGGEAFAAKVLYENVARFSSTMEDKPHAHSAVYLLVTVLVGFIPWTLLVAGPAVKAGLGSVRQWRGVRPLWRGFLALSRFDRFALITVGAFIVFFSIPSSKRSVYLLPAYPFMAYFAARFIEARCSDAVWRRFGRAVSGVVLFLVGCIGAYRLGVLDLGWFVKKPDALFDATFFATHLSGLGFTTVGWPFVLIPMLVGASVLTIVSPGAGEGSRRRVVTLVGVLYLAAIAVVLPAVVEPLSLKRYAGDIAPLVPRDSRLYSYGTEFYGVSFYLKREIYRASPEVEPGARVFVLERKVAEFRASLGSGRTAELVSTSNYGVVKPRDRVALLEIRSAASAPAGGAVSPSIDGAGEGR